MEVVEACSSHLSNREVLDLLRKNVSKNQTNLATILYETTSYLESSPAATSSLSSLANFLAATKAKKYNLTSMERIQLTNLKPQNTIELNLIIDNIDEKFNEEQQNDLLDLIKRLDEVKDEKQEQSTKKLKGG